MKSDLMIHKKLIIAGAVCAAFCWPSLTGSPYLLQVATLALIMAVLAEGLNIMLGFAGQLSLGHAGFYCIGAYASALFALKLGLSPWLGMALAVIVSGLFGLALGFPSLRLRGPYFIIVSVGFGEIIRQTALNWESLTKGPLGLTGVPPLPGVQLGGVELNLADRSVFYRFALVVTLVVVWFVYSLARSRIGRALKAIREDAIAAEALGIPLASCRIMACVLSAAITGLGGALYAHYVGFISPDSFTFSEGVRFVINVIIGGSGTVAGPLLGSVVLTFLLEILRITKDYRLVVYGVLLLITIKLLPGGVVSIPHVVRSQWRWRPLGASRPSERIPKLLDHQARDVEPVRYERQGGTSG